jgi:hypothetical protein
MFKQDDVSNDKLYGRRVDPEDILFKGVVPAPAAAGPLTTALNQISPHGGEPFDPK